MRYKKKQLKEISHLQLLSVVDGYYYFTAWLLLLLLSLVFRLHEATGSESISSLLLISVFFSTIYLLLYVLLIFQGVWRLSLIWIGIPYFLFAFGWLRWYLAIPCVLVWMIALFRTALIEKPVIIKPNLSHLIAILLITSWVYLSGAGGHGNQSPDHAMHNGRLLDLIRYAWPVHYSDGLLIRDPAYGPLYSYFVGYAAYYLPAALWGKFSSYFSALEFLHVWTLFGFWLAVAWLWEFLEQKMVLVAAIVLLLFGGVDFAGVLLTLSRDHANTSFDTVINALSQFSISLPNDTGSLDFWPVSQFGFFFGNYISNAGQIYWSPHQTVAAWVVGGLLFKAFLKNRAGCFCFIFALLVYWSPMNMAAAALFPLVMVFKDGVKGFIDAVTFENIIAGGSLLFVFLAYYFSGSAGVNPFSWLWESLDIYQVWWMLLFFHFFSWGIYATLIFSGLSIECRQVRIFFAVLCTSLFLLSLISYGVYNDLLCRGSAILMFFLMILLLRRFRILWYSKKILSSFVLVFFVSIGSWSSVEHLLRSFAYFDQKMLPQSVVNSIHGWEFLGPTDSFFVRNFSRDLPTEVLVGNTDGLPLIGK